MGYLLATLLPARPWIELCRGFSRTQDQKASQISSVHGDFGFPPDLSLVRQHDQGAARTADSV